MSAGIDSWIVCQLGARENYSVARSLARKDKLKALVTDLWCPPKLPLRSFLGRVGERNHPDLKADLVWAPTARAILREVASSRSHQPVWEQIMQRNSWFQRMALKKLQSMKPTGSVTLFAYSYAASEILTYAKAQGWTTVLGQIDPGPTEARLVEQLYQNAGQGRMHERIPESYWENWHRETAQADAIVVNSDWSKRGLVDEGVPAEKITTLPLSFDGEMRSLDKIHPIKFDADRPLKLLFLGQITLRKGIDIVLEAMRTRPDLPLHLDVVGPLQITVPDWVRHDQRIHFHGSVPRSAVTAFYQKADIFLFPTRSDGFGLTQLEAMNVGVPVIASDRCGEVVEDGRNGAILHDLNPSALLNVIEELITNPGQLRTWRSAARVKPRFHLDQLGFNLLGLGQRLSKASETGSKA
jgi:hypothetical protein